LAERGRNKKETGAFGPCLLDHLDPSEQRQPRDVFRRQARER